MPFKSDAQRRYFNANRRQLEAQGVNVDEWNKSSKGKKLPEKVKPSTKSASAWDSLNAEGILDRILEHPAGQIMARGLLGGAIGGGLGAMGGGLYGLVRRPAGGENRLTNSVNGAYNNAARYALLGGLLGGGRAMLDTGVPSIMDAYRGTRDDVESAMDSMKFSSYPGAAEDIVPMSTTTGALADYFTPGAWGGERAGRSQVLADAAGVPASFRVKHPITGGIGDTALSALAGAGFGGLTGMGIGALSDAMDGGENYNVLPGGLVGAGLGALGGGMLGPLLSAYLRRQDMQGINDSFDAGHGEPSVPDLSAASMLLLPGRGPHRKGQIDAYRHLTGDSEDVRNNAVLNDIAYTAPMVAGAALGPLVAPLEMGHLYGQNFATQSWSESLKNSKRQRILQDMSGMKAASADKRAGWEEIKQQIVNMSNATAGAVKRQGGNAVETLQRAATGAGTALLPWRERAMLAAKGLLNSAMVQGQIAKQHIQEGLADPNRRYLYAAALGAGGIGAASTAAELMNRRPHKRLLSSLIGGAGTGGLLAGIGLYAADRLRMTGYNPANQASPASPQAAMAAPAFTGLQPGTTGPAAVEQLTQQINALPLEQRAAKLEELRKMTEPTTYERVYNNITSNPITSVTAVGVGGHLGLSHANRAWQGYEANQVVPGTTVGGKVTRRNSLAFQMPDADIRGVLSKELGTAFPSLNGGALDQVLRHPEIAHAMRYDPQSALAFLKSKPQYHPAVVPGAPIRPTIEKLLYDQLSAKPHILSSLSDAVNRQAQTTGFHANTQGLGKRLWNMIPGTTKVPLYTLANSANVANKSVFNASKPRMIGRGLAGLAAIPVAAAGEQLLKSVFSSE